MNSLKSGDRVAGQQRFTLLELLDRLLDKGVMVKGEILLTVADIDLVYLNVGLLLSSVKSIEKAYGRGSNGDNNVGGDNGHNGNATLMTWQTSLQEEFVDATELDEIRSDEAKPDVIYPVAVRPDELQLDMGRQDVAMLDEPGLDDQSGQIVGEQGAEVDFGEEDDVDGAEEMGVNAKPLSAAIDYGLDQLFQPKANIDPENVEKGLARLVLTLVELLRKLMEKQAVRRIDDKQLNAEEVERMGNAFFLLDKKMEELKMTFDFKDGDLNLDLGPLGDLM